MNRGVPPTDPNARTGVDPARDHRFRKANSLLEVFVVRRATGASASFADGMHGKRVEF